MKKLIIATFAIFTACAHGDQDPPQDDSRVIGHYRLTQGNIPHPTDLNGDGATSSNLVTESNCYSGTLILHPENTYDLVHTYAMADGNQYSCHTETESGIWNRTHTILRLTDQNGEMTVYNHGTVNNILTRNEASWHYPHEGTTVTGPVSIVFSKL